MESVKNYCPLCGGNACLVLGREDRYPMYNRFICKTFNRVFSVGNIALHDYDGALKKRIKNVLLEKHMDTSANESNHLKFFFEPSYKVVEKEKMLGFVNLAEM